MRSSLAAILPLVSLRVKAPMTVWAWAFARPKMVLLGVSAPMLYLLLRALVMMFQVVSGFYFRSVW